MDEQIIIVDEQDHIVGSMEKLEVHQKGVLHRAFSVLILNEEGEILLQKRYHGKYHSPSLWTNSCCSHQRLGETLEESINRRIQEEMGFQCEVEEVFHFLYRVEFDNHLIEHEIDHVFVGTYNGEVTPDPLEVEDIRWISIQDLREDMKNFPNHYTYWFRILMDQPEMDNIL